MPYVNRRERPGSHTASGWGKGYLLLVMVPAVGVLHWAHAASSWQFLTALLAILPLAAVMGKATEQLVRRTGAGVGGLLNATFGNAAELIIAMSMLFKGLDTAVKASVTGSIIGNILLVLGASLFAGGLKRPTLRFNRTAAATSSTMMVLAAIGLLVPAIFHALPEVVSQRLDQSQHLEHELSLAVAVILIATYALSLLFSLKTHKELYNPADEETASDTESEAWGLWKAITILLIASIAVGLVSEVLASAIVQAGKALGLTQVFLGVIVVAIVGNAAEHSTAVFAALKNQADLAVGIAMGSAMQVALLVAPVLIFASYLRADPMDLEFTTLEVVAVILGVVVARMVAEDGESNWLEGIMLLVVYAILGMAFYVLP